jgi:hypothetical protein
VPKVLPQTGQYTLQIYGYYPLQLVAINCASPSYPAASEVRQLITWKLAVSYRL